MPFPSTFLTLKWMKRVFIGFVYIQIEEPK